MCRNFSSCFESGQGVGARLAGQPAFEGLVETFDFALGLRVVGVAVLLGDAQAWSRRSKALRPPAANGGWCRPSVVGQGGGREAVVRGGGEEGGHDRGDGDRCERGAGEQVAGVVIEEVQDLGVGPVGQGPVGEV